MPVQINLICGFNLILLRILFLYGHISMLCIYDMCVYVIENFSFQQFADFDRKRN